jgi:chemotaxis protein MotA
MDLATLIGLLGAIGVLISAIVLGGSAGTFVDVSSILIVMGGTSMAVLIKFPLGQFFSAFKVAGRAFMHKGDDPGKLIAQTVEMAQLARREGLLGLESFEVDNPFLQTGIRLVVDGHEPAFVRKVLSQEIDLTIDRQEKGENVFRAIGEVAPAMGMIGTLIGLVQMLANMVDPRAIGPAMAVALLTTLYGAFIANCMALPLADKLAYRSEEERLNRALILEGLVAIQDGLNPRLIEELLKTYLPGHLRERTAEQAAA